MLTLWLLTDLIISNSTLKHSRTVFLTTTDIQQTRRRTIPKSQSLAGLLRERHVVHQEHWTAFDRHLKAAGWFIPTPSNPIPQFHQTRKYTFVTCSSVRSVFLGHGNPEQKRFSRAAVVVRSDWVSLMRPKIWLPQSKPLHYSTPSQPTTSDSQLQQQRQWIVQNLAIEGLPS